MVELKRVYWSRQALRLAYSAVVMWLGISVLLALHAEGERTFPGPGLLRRDRGPARNVGRRPGRGQRCLACVLWSWLIVAAVVHGQDVRRRDPVRRFTRQQRREGMARAAGLCEMEAGFRRRCSRPAEHGDHFYPWSKGGSTSLQNFVAACARCNRAKGRQDSFAGPAGTDRTTTAGLRCARRFGQCRRTAAAPLG